MTTTPAVRIRELEAANRQLAEQVIQVRRAYQVLGEDLARAQARAERCEAIEATARRLMQMLTTYGVAVAHEDAARVLAAALKKEDA